MHGGASGESAQGAPAGGPAWSAPGGETLWVHRPDPRGLASPGLREAQGWTGSQPRPQLRCEAEMNGSLKPHPGGSLCRVTT